MTTPVRLLLTRFGVSDTEVVETTVVPGEAIGDIEARLDIGLSDSEKTKWIYMGRMLDTTIPTVVNANSSFHIMINRISEKDRVSPANKNRATRLNWTDKILLTLVYLAFASILTFAWWTLKMTDTFNPVSAGILYVTTFIWLVSLVQLAKGRFTAA